MSRFDEIYPLFQEYDMFAQTIELLKAPNVYKAMTPYGSFVCKRTSASPNRLKVIGGALRNLHQRGWDGAIPIAFTKYDQPFIQRGDSIYYLTAWQPPSEQVEDWTVPMIMRLAELHQLTQNYRFDDPRQVEALIDSLLKRWEYWVQQMKKGLSIAQERTYPSSFDIVFLANQSFIAETATTAIRLLREWKERHRTHAHFRLSINHGYPHPAHLLLDRSGKARLINFDRSLFDTPARDLTLFYRTYFHLVGDESAASELYRRYISVFPLRPEEADLLAVFLHYPERVMRDIEAYYAQKHGWNELYAVKRFEKDIDRLMRLCRWVRQAF
jgi:spore coat protein YsxE